MPRKNAAQKRAKALKEAQQKQLENGGDSKITSLPLNIEDLKKELREEENNDDANSDSDDEEEDEYGELLTEDVETQLNDVLKMIKTGDQKLFDSSVSFFKDDDKNSDSNGKKEKSSKPVYLKDYHREALLSIEQADDESAESFDAFDDGEKPYALQQKEDKESLVKEIHNALGGDDNSDGDDDDDDDGFLIKKDKKQEPTEDKQMDVINLPDPSKDGEKFLEAFMESHAWLPNKGKEVKIENEDDSDFDKAAEEFENAYNFRYEDPKATEIISYARSQATMRREKMNSRKRERLKHQEEAKTEKEEINKELKKKKQKKVNLVMDRIKEIRQAVGDDVSDEKIMKVFGDSLMNEDFDDNDWDAKMSEIFDDEYYAGDDDAMVKPEWDDNDDDIYQNGAGEEVEKVEDDENEEVEAVDEEQPGEEGKDTDKKSHNSKKKEEKYAKKQEKNKIKEVAERLVESKTLDILDEVQEERGRGKEKSEYKFKYREVSPESFGLTYNEIFQADDKALNDLIGLKKLAPYRPHDKAAKDKRKITKSKNMREWRKRTFGKEDGISETDDLEIKIPSIVFDNNSSNSAYDQGPKRKKRKSKSKSKSKK